MIVLTGAELHPELMRPELTKPDGLRVMKLAFDGPSEEEERAILWKF